MRARGEHTVRVPDRIVISRDALSVRTTSRTHEPRDLGGCHASIWLSKRASAAAVFDPVA